MATLFRPTRSKGQCFLRDPRFITRIVETLSPCPGETLVEIGAGEGQITFPVLEAGARVIAVEADPRLAERLRKSSAVGLDLVQADASKLDFDELLDQRGLDQVRGYGNLPYSVAAPILLRLLSSAARFSSLTLMFQKEVAERLVAKPSTKDYSFLSVVTQHASRPRVLFRIPPEAFRPRPRVVSALVHLELLDAGASKVGDERLFRKLVRVLLAHRRKTIANNIKRANVRGVSADVLLAAVSGAGVDPTRRAETLSVEEFEEISRICALQG